MTLSKKQIKNHYQKAEPVIKKWSENGKYNRVGSNGPDEGWYEYPQGYDGNIRRPKILTTKGDLSKDYNRLVGNAARKKEDNNDE